MKRKLQFLYLIWVSFIHDKNLYSTLSNLISSNLGIVCILSYFAFIHEIVTSECRFAYFMEGHSKLVQFKTSPSYLMTYAPPTMQICSTCFCCDIGFSFTIAVRLFTLLCFWRLKVNRDVPRMTILLSKDPLSPSLNGSVINVNSKCASSVLIVCGWSCNPTAKSVNTGNWRVSTSRFWAGGVSMKY